jgi:hypothetical protein
MSELAVEVENLVKEFAGSGKQPIRAVVYPGVVRT